MPKTILIAASDPNIVYLLQRYAEESGFEVARCGREKDLPQLAKQITPELIVLQLEPPDHVWQQSLHSLKSDPATHRIPVVAYSCFEEIVRNQVDGVAVILQKSVLYGDFIAALEQAGVYVD
jgi:DNA-binding response OmpR family regulator